MKKTILALVLFGFSILSGAQETNQFTIRGYLPDSSYDGSTVYLSAENTQSQMRRNKLPSNGTDSTRIENGKFVFLNKTSDEIGELYLLKIQNTAITCWVVSEPGTIEVLFSKHGTNVYALGRGTPLNDQLANELLDPIYTFTYKMDSVMNQVKENSGNLPEKEMYTWASDYYSKSLQFFKKNIHYPMGEYLFMLFGIHFKEEDANEILAELPESSRQIFKEKKEKLSQVNEIPDSVSVGQNFVDFERQTLNNEQFKLSDAVRENKWTLLDFWASWCIPCLREIPDLINFYNTYQNKGLLIIGISLDENQIAWKNALKKNQMPWEQLIDTENPQGRIQDIYGVKAIPHTILIDSNGKIVARGLRAKELAEMIDTLDANE